MLPFKPEPLEQLQARFHKALTPVYGVVEMAKRTHRIGMMPKHVFDCDDGLRIIVSVEQDDRTAIYAGKPYLHVSFSTIKPVEKLGRTALVAMLNQVVMELSRGRLPEPVVQVTPGGIVHFFYDGTDTVARLDKSEREQVQSNWLGQARIK